jgi:hypothetical protein
VSRTIVRILAVIPGLPMLVIGLSLILQPAVALEAIHMPLLEGLALSTQLGDLTSFFLCSAVFIFMGAYHGSPRWLYAGAALIFVAALARIYAWQVHGAGLPPEPIAVEIISTIWLSVCAVILSKQD